MTANVRVYLTSDSDGESAVQVVRDDQEAWFGTYKKLAAILSNPVTSKAAEAARGQDEEAAFVHLCGLLDRQVKPATPLQAAAMAWNAAIAWKEKAAPVAPSERGDDKFRPIPKRFLCDDCQKRGIPDTPKFNWPLCSSCIERSVIWRAGLSSQEGE